MKKIIKCFIFMTILFSEVVLADSKTLTTVSIPLKADFRPAKALGLIISKKDVKQVWNAQVEEVDSNSYIVSFSVDKATTPLTTPLSAIAFSSDEKQNAFADVKAFGNVLFPPAEQECISANKENLTTRVKSIAVQKKIVSIREARRQNKRNEFLASFDDKTKNKLDTLAVALGIPKEPALDSEELHPAILVDRLSRLEHALMNYLVGREKIEGNLE